MNPRSWQSVLAPVERERLRRSARHMPPDLDRCAVLDLTSPDRGPHDAGRPAAEQVRAAAVAAGRPVLDAAADRAGPSAFFGTALLSQLLPFGVDTLVVVGGTASDSVRATVVDGFSYGLRMAVVEPSVVDDSDGARAYSLYDVALRYGLVLGLDEVLVGLSSPAGQVDSARDDTEEHEQEQSHGHGHGHSHLVHQSAAGHGHDHDAQRDLELPAVLRQEVPAGARPVSVSEYPVHGHVLAHAGQELLDAASSEMSAGFAPLPHAIAVLTEQTLGREDDPRYREALRLTEGGAIVIGVGYERSPSGPAGSVDPGPCPECGSSEHSIDEVVPVAATQGLDTGIMVFLCQNCGAAWDVPFRPEDG